LKSFRVVAKSKGFIFKLPWKTCFSIFNSPYPAHKAESALDVYFDGTDALMPLDEGRIVNVKWFESLKLRSDAYGKEPLILIKLNEEYALKVLHVKPKVKIGEKIFLGDPLGKMIVSGYFPPWTSLHAHFELRTLKNNPYRARGAFKVKVDREFMKPLKVKSRVGGEILFEVAENFKSFSLVKPLNLNENKTSLPLKFSGKFYCFDGGIPHHKFGVAVGVKKLGLLKTLNGDVVGKGFRRMYSGVAFKTNVKPMVDGEEILGIEGILNCGLLKLIGLRLKLNSGDIVGLKFQGFKC